MNFPIVGIGASAGGLEALVVFFKNLPVPNGLGFVVILHLDPTRKGMMPELLQRHTKMKVLPGEDKLEILPDHVYVLPPNKSMSVANRHLYLFNPKETHGLRLPIDFFLTSLADDKKTLGIGIIFSGMGSDGSKGLVALKKNQGLVLVQEPITCKFDSMPTSAIQELKSYGVDFIGSPKSLAEKLISLLSPPESNATETKASKEDLDSLKEIQILLQKKTGHDFRNYKQNTLLRRIERRITLHSLKRIGEYATYVKKNPEELDLLFKELLIGVTQFFRDQIVWEKLDEFVFPEMSERIKNHRSIRIWSVACSTGEEAYSLAISV